MSPAANRADRSSSRARKPSRAVCSAPTSFGRPRYEINHVAGDPVQRPRNASKHPTRFVSWAAFAPLATDYSPLDQWEAHRQVPVISGYIRTVDFPQRPDR